MELANKTLIVTGASSGIGAAAARLFASEGANVVLAARRSDELQSVAEDITRGGGSVVYRAGDVLDEAYAGVLTELALDRFQAPIHAYLTAHFLTARAAGRHMTRRGSGVIITLTARAAEVTMVGRILALLR